MAIKHSESCDSCKSNTPSDSWIEIGLQVHIEGGIEGDTNHTLYQCGDCGATWIKIVDQGGIGGHGTFYHSLTERFFN